jgi:Glycosyltransferase 61
MYFFWIIPAGLLFLVSSQVIPQGVDRFLDLDYSKAPDNGSYSCDELTRWLGTEKHYSNDKREILFKLLENRDCTDNGAPVIFLDNARFSPQKKFHVHATSGVCSIQDDYAVAYLSNFSINNNFSHFLHSLVRLFCALIDARWVVWDSIQRKFTKRVNYSIWLDEYFKITPSKRVWLEAMTLGGKLRALSPGAGPGGLKKGECAATRKLLYGSGCVRLLPPEKWHGYPHCRASDVLPAFGEYMRQVFGAKGLQELLVIDDRSHVLDGSLKNGPKLRVAFAVRDVTDLTGKRSISNLADVQRLLRKTQHIKTSTENVTFEHFDVEATVKYMASAHVFVSVHGAGMTNMFFMNPGSAVVEIIPYPLCNCESPDYFYGVGGYYHGSAVAAGLRHYAYCVPSTDTVWHTKPANLRDGVRCSWKHLHAVEAVRLDTTRFVSLMRNVERDLVVTGMITLTHPIININPNANG